MAVTLIEKQHSCKGFPKNQHTLNKDHLDGYSCWGAEKHAEKLKENSKKKTSKIYYWASTVTGGNTDTGYISTTLAEGDYKDVFSTVWE